MRPARTPSPAPPRPRRSPVLPGLALVCLLLAPPGAYADLPPIVLVSRDLAEAPDPAGREQAIERAAAGKLLLHKGEGQVRTLVDASLPGAPAGTPVDVADPDVSPDAERIVFAGYSREERGWRIFEVGADGLGLRQITRSDRSIDLARYGPAADRLRGHDDVDPCYLPDGRICFVSTRYAGIAPDGRLRATNLHVVNADGSDVRRITSERFGADTPVVEPASGQIVYSRFWRTPPVPRLAGDAPEPILPGSPGYEDIVVEPSDTVLRGVSEREFPGVNSWFLAAINPDGTDLRMWSGFRLDRELTQAYRPSFLPDGQALAVFLPVTPFIGYPRGYGLRRFRPGPVAPSSLGGPQVFPRRHGFPPRVNYHYASAEAIEDGRLVVTAVPVGDESRDYALYVQPNEEEIPTLLYNDPAAIELDAVPLATRARPPVIEDRITERVGDDAPSTGARPISAARSSWTSTTSRARRFRTPTAPPASRVASGCAPRGRSRRCRARSTPASRPRRWSSSCAPRTPSSPSTRRRTSSSAPERSAGTSASCRRRSSCARRSTRARSCARRSSVRRRSGPAAPGSERSSCG